MNTTDTTERLWGCRFKSGPSLALENLLPVNQNVIPDPVACCPGSNREGCGPELHRAGAIQYGLLAIFMLGQYLEKQAEFSIMP